MGVCAYLDMHKAVASAMSIAKKIRHLSTIGYDKRFDKEDSVCIVH